MSSWRLATTSVNGALCMPDTEMDSSGFTDQGAICGIYEDKGLAMMLRYHGNAKVASKYRHRRIASVHVAHSVLRTSYLVNMHLGTTSLVPASGKQ